MAVLKTKLPPSSPSWGGGVGEQGACVGVAKEEVGVRERSSLALMGPKPWVLLPQLVRTSSNPEGEWS